MCFCTRAGRIFFPCRVLQKCLRTDQCSRTEMQRTLWQQILFVFGKKSHQQNSQLTDETSLSGRILTALLYLWGLPVTFILEQTKCKKKPQNSPVVHKVSQQAPDHQQNGISHTLQAATKPRTPVGMLQQRAAKEVAGCKESLPQFFFWAKAGGLEVMQRLK